MTFAKEAKFALALMILFLSIYLLCMMLISNEPQNIDVNVAASFKSTWMTIFTFTALIGGYLRFCEVFGKNEPV